MNTKTKPMLVMPGIYRFSFPGNREESKWGWHQAGELLDALNNIRASMGRGPATPGGILSEYEFVSPESAGVNHFAGMSGWGTNCLIVNDGHLSSLTDEGVTDWLGTSAIRGYYLPAKLGMRLIKAAKNPLVSSLRKMLC